MNYRPIVAKMELSRETLDHLSDDDLRLLEREVSRRFEEYMRKRLECLLLFGREV